MTTNDSLLRRLAGLLLGRRSDHAPSWPVDAPLPREVEDDLRALAQSGRKIEAIKAYREATGAGLADAKSAVERLARAA